MEMISENMLKRLNDQLVVETDASQKYLAIASWCDNHSLEGAAAFFYSHATEERDHMMRFFKYINEVGGHAIVPATNQPQLEFSGLLEICEISLKNEQSVTATINSLVDLAIQEKDHVTYDFLRFFVEEQKEEEVLFRRVIDRIKLIGDGPQSLFYADSELMKLNNQKTVKQAGGSAE